jgi:Tfp pilus assembly protein PilN
LTQGAVNLASRPFANTRPLRRVAVALWVVGAALAVVAGTLYWRSFFGIVGGREKMATVDRALAEERRRLAEAEDALAAIDLRRQNVEAEYLQARLRERTFPWSDLFEHLAGVLPRKVRLVSLSPQAGDSARERRGTSGTAAVLRSRRGSSVGSGSRVNLQMTGVAANDEALTDLLDRLFASQWFANPSLPNERRDSGQIGFSLGVTYLPKGRAAAAAEAAAARREAEIRAAATPPPRAKPAPRRSGDEL